ncbi:helix-turn-helix domain-containing protein [Leekyejoonella antrihumi]|nr:helix-turn-helix transcriptional regulator [Leekyejoonella antrihumi]
MAEPTEVRAAFGARVAELRREQGMSQAELAAASGVDRVTVSRVERGLQDLGVVRLVALADALDRLPGDLLDGQ